MAMTITWTVNFGPVHWTVPDDEVLEKVAAVQSLGFEPTVSFPKE